jgi:glucose-1-phosphate thymidylyltransferase
MKGIILAGGAGSRLYPLTLIASKQLQPVYDKPMVYYPLSTLLEQRIKDIALISTPQDLPRFEQLLGSGERFGANITYISQPRPEGIAQAFLLAEQFIGNDPVSLILGDNLFSGGASTIRAAYSTFKTGAHLFAYPVEDPQRYGVILFEKNKPKCIVEKPTNPPSKFAVPGLYIYDSSVASRAKGLKPSQRGELEITDLNNTYFEEGAVQVSFFERGFAWLDAGTSTSLHDASAYVQTIERRQGIKLGCPEEAAYSAGLLNRVNFEAIVKNMPRCEYRSYLEKVLERA